MSCSLSSLKTYDDAIALYNIDDRDDYTLALTQKLNELGIKEETK